MRKILAIIIICCIVGLKLRSQDYFSSNNDSVEVGIIEHLDSIIPGNLVFHNEQDSLVKLRDLINKPTVLTFVYFDCPGLCSPLLNGVSDVIEKSDMELGKEYQIITISFNFKDTPEKAKLKKQNFLKKHSKAHSGAWIYLTGDSTNIYRICNRVGFKFKRAGLDFIHPAAIMVVSPQGKITRYLYGLTFLPLDLKMAIAESQKGLSRPSINRVLEYCYVYDPAGRRYVLDVMKISGTIILFIIILFAGTLFFRTSFKNRNNRKL
jgi:protein SCO1